MDQHGLPLEVWIHFLRISIGGHEAILSFETRLCKQLYKKKSLVDLNNLICI
ncbi:hypothetical protein HanIR_Chr10g0460371 [Helianthus annuus]|nr:hypothetical protein HanIR_Chr10g0460371 [Helianthus annuus]